MEPLNKQCPITKREFFMEIEHPDLGSIPTYGGPFDSYSIPYTDIDGDLRCERFDHDRGDWVEGGEPLDVYLTTKQPDDDDLPGFVERAQRSEAAKEPETGWGNPDQFSSRSKFHYFKEGRSLCGKYGRFANSFTLEEGNDEHSDNCAACKKKRLAAKAKAA